MVFINVIKQFITCAFSSLYRLGSDVEKLYPFAAMLEQFKKFGKFGAYTAAVFLPMMTADGSAAPDFNVLLDDTYEGR